MIICDRCKLNGNQAVIERVYVSVQRIGATKSDTAVRCDLCNECKNTLETERLKTYIEHFLRENLKDKA